MTDHTTRTLGEFLSHKDDIIRRNATSILKRLQKKYQPVCAQLHCENIADESYSMYCKEHKK